MPPRAPRGATALRLDTPVKFLKGIGERRAELLERLGIRTAQDLLWHLPHRYIDASTVTPLVKAEVGQEVACIGRVVAKGVVPTRRGLRIFHAVLRDDSGVLECVWPGQAFLDRTIVVGQTLLVSGPVRFYHGRQMAPREFVILADADSEAEPLAGGKVLPVYPATEGLSHKIIRGLVDRHLDALIAAVAGCPAGRRSGGPSIFPPLPRCAPRGPPPGVRARGGARPAAPRVRRAARPAAHAHPGPLGGQAKPQRRRLYRPSRSHDQAARGAALGAHRGPAAGAAGDHRAT